MGRTLHFGDVEHERDEVEDSFQASLVAHMVRNLPQCRRTRFDCWVRKIPWRRKWQPTPVFLPGKSYGQRSLASYSRRSHKETDMAERLTVSFPSCILGMWSMRETEQWKIAFRFLVWVMGENDDAFHRKGLE